MEEQSSSPPAEAERPKPTRRTSSSEFKRQDSITLLANKLMWVDTNREDETNRDAFTLIRYTRKFSRNAETFSSSQERTGARISTTSQCSSIPEESDLNDDFAAQETDAEEDNLWENESSSVEDKSFVLDPDGDVCYIWLGVVTIAILYNFWTIIFRTAFRADIKPWERVFAWVDYLTDFIYIVDIFVQFHVGYLEHGILVRDQRKLREHYRNNSKFIRDILAMFPAFTFSLFYDFPLVVTRFPRLLKLSSLIRFVDMADSRTSYPNRLRVLRLLIYLSTVIHWMACFQYMLSEYEGFGSNNWVYPALEGENAELLTKYIKCWYWSILTLTAIGETPNPETRLEYIINGMTFLVGVMIFAAVVGNVGDVISNMNAARMDFQSRMDCIKQYMNHRGVPEILQRRVKKWLDYSWTRTQALDEANLLGMLPGQLRAEIAIHVHLETLKKVDIFSSCERGFLCELVLKLRSQIFSPGDYICREGEVGREMYIINHGKVECIIKVKETNKRKVVRTLKKGTYFGEISLLKLDGGCNKRTADIRSVGYSELFILSKKDLLQALHYYPEAREILEKLGRERLGSYGAQPGEKEKPGTSLQDQDDNTQPKSKRLPFTSLNSKKEAHSPSSEVIKLSAILRELKSFDSLLTKEKMDQLLNQVNTLKRELETKEKDLAACKEEIDHLKKKLLSADSNPGSSRRKLRYRQNLDCFPNGGSKKLQKLRRESSPVPLICSAKPVPRSSPFPVQKIPKIAINDEEVKFESDKSDGDEDFLRKDQEELGKKAAAINLFTSSFLGPNTLGDDLGFTSACPSEFESDSDFIMSD